MLIYIRRPCILRSIQNHTFTSLSLPQFLANIIIFTDWGKQGVTVGVAQECLHTIKTKICLLW